MRKHRSDRIIAVLAVLLMGLGLIVIYAIGPMRANFMNSAYGTDYPASYFFTHQIVSVALAVGAMVLAWRFPYTTLRKYAKIIMIAGLAACVVLWGLAIVGSSLAVCQLGACRWISLGPLGSFQPAELLKLGLVLYLAQLVALRRKEGKLDSRDEFWFPFGVMAGLALFFVVVIQKDFGSGVPIIAIILSILWMGGVEKKRFWQVVGLIVVVGVLAVVSSPHRMERLLTFGGGEGSDSYHVDNALIAIGTGGFGGVGVGNSVQATGYLPESINDSVFAVMGETFGFVGLAIVIACFTVLLSRLLKVAETLVNKEASLVVTGIFAWVLTHMVVNIAAMTGVIPLTGITLPLLSYGGTSMIFVSFGLGLCLQLSQYTGRMVNDNYGNRSGNRRASRNLVERRAR